MSLHSYHGHLATQRDTPKTSYKKLIRTFRKESLSTNVKTRFKNLQYNTERQNNQTFLKMCVMVNIFPLTTLLRIFRSFSRQDSSEDHRTEPWKQTLPYIAFKSVSFLR